METFLFLFEMLGTIAFAASGAVLGVRKGLDVFGVCFLGLTTACGGGMVRDVLLGNTPPAAFQNPTASAVAVVTSLIMFLSGVRHLLMGNQRRYDLFMLLMDSAGLGIFTVMGVRDGMELRGSAVPVPAGVRRRTHRRGRRAAAGCDGRRYALYFREAYLRLRLSRRRGDLRGAAAAGRGDDGHAGRCGGGVCHPVSVGPLPVESAPSQRLKKRRNFPDMARISCENRQDAPLDNPKEPCYHNSILKKGLEKDAVREELQRDAVMG